MWVISTNIGVSSLFLTRFVTQDVIVFVYVFLNTCIFPNCNHYFSINLGLHQKIKHFPFAVNVKVFLLKSFLKFSHSNYVLNLHLYLLPFNFSQLIFQVVLNHSQNHSYVVFICFSYRAVISQLYTWEFLGAISENGIQFHPQVHDLFSVSHF